MYVEKFLQCPGCMTWLSSREFIEGVGIEPMGLRLDDDIEWNYYLFRHRAAHCGTTFTINAEEFNPFLTEPVPERIRTGEEGCEGRCITLKDHAQCSQECHWAPYRRLLIQMMHNRDNAPARQN